MRLDELTITLSDSHGRLTVETLTKALENALEMLRGIESSIIESGVEVRWEVVRARMESPLQMTFCPRVRAKGRARPAVGRKIVEACLVGIVGIENGTSLPRYFNDEALDAARKLVKVASSNGTSLTLSSNGSDEVKLTEKAIQHIDEMSSKSRLYVDFSTIEKGGWRSFRRTTTTAFSFGKHLRTTRSSALELTIISGRPANF